MVQLFFHWPVLLKSIKTFTTINAPTPLRCKHHLDERQYGPRFLANDQIVLPATDKEPTSVTSKTFSRISRINRAHASNSIHAQRFYPRTLCEKFPLTLRCIVGREERRLSWRHMVLILSVSSQNDKKQHLWKAALRILLVITTHLLTNYWTFHRLRTP